MNPPSAGIPARFFKDLAMAALRGVAYAAVGVVAIRWGAMRWFPFHDRPAPAVSAADLAAHDALRRFLDAPDAAARTAFALTDGSAPAAPSPAPDIERDDPAVGSFQLSQEFSSPDIRWFVAERDRSRSPVLAPVRFTDGSWRVDAGLFTQTCQESFRAFCGRPAPGAAVFRVRLRPVPDPDGLRVEVRDPADGSMSLQLAIRRPDLDALMRPAMADGAERTATVELAWLHDPASGGLTASLRRHLCWGYAGLDAAPAAADPELPMELRPPPVPDADTIDALTSAALGLSPVASDDSPVVAFPDTSSSEKVAESGTSPP